jgi:hypothetical protein
MPDPVQEPSYSGLLVCFDAWLTRFAITIGVNNTGVKKSPNEGKCISLIE